jgi:hypothetical protein
VTTPPRGRGWRKRTWAYLIWTLAAIGTGVGHRIANGPPTHPGFDYSGIEYVGLLFLWLLGLAAIWAIALLSDEVRYRRKMRAIAKEREGEPRRF